MTKLLSTLLILTMLSCSGCSLLAGHALKKITGSSDKGITATANIGDNKKQAEITAKKTTQTQGDNSGVQALHDITQIEASVAQLSKAQQVNAREVDKIVTNNNNRLPWIVWLILTILIAVLIAIVFYFVPQPKWVQIRGIRGRREIKAELNRD